MPKTMELDATVKVRLHGRVTLPLSIRNALDIEDGDTVHIAVRKVIPENKAIESSHEDPRKAPVTA